MKEGVKIGNEGRKKRGNERKKLKKDEGQGDEDRLNKEEIGIKLMNKRNIEKDLIK